MVGKYLEENCLYVTDPKAVKKLYDLLNSEPTPNSPSVACNKSYQERAAFLNKINKSV